SSVSWPARASERSRGGVGKDVIRSRRVAIAASLPEEPEGERRSNDARCRDHRRDESERERRPAAGQQIDAADERRPGSRVATTCTGAAGRKVAAARAAVAAWAATIAADHERDSVVARRWAGRRCGRGGGIATDRDPIRRRTRRRTWRRGGRSGRTYGRPGRGPWFRLRRGFRGGLRFRLGRRIRCRHWLDGYRPRRQLVSEPVAAERGDGHRIG